MGISGIEEAHEHEEATATMKTGINGQSLNIDGWFASHADSGTPGPHVRLVAEGINGAVLKTSQIPELIECLNLVAERIDRLWERDGEKYITARHMISTTMSMRNQVQPASKPSHNAIAAIMIHMAQEHPGPWGPSRLPPRQSIFLNHGAKTICITHACTEQRHPGKGRRRQVKECARNASRINGETSPVTPSPILGVRATASTG